MDTLSQDIRFALRSRLRSPRYAPLALLSLAPGLPAHATVLTPLHTLLPRPLPFPAPARVVNLYPSLAREGQFEGGWSYPDYVDVGNAGGAFTAVGLYDTRQWNIGGLDEPERIEGARITASLFPMLGIRTE